MEQIQFHRARITDCETMSQTLNAKVQQKKSAIGSQEDRVSQLRAELLAIKTENVKKVLQLENLEVFRQKEHSKASLRNRKTTSKLKTEYSRAFHCNLSAGDDELAL